MPMTLSETSPLFRPEREQDERQFAHLAKIDRRQQADAITLAHEV